MRTRFILIETSHAGNVGSVARAMKVMGFDDLVLVRPRWADVLQREEALAEQNKGDVIRAKVLDVDIEKERISLGVKQLDGDPYTNFIATHEKNSIVNCTVKSVDARGAVLTLDGENEGYLRASEFSRDRIEDLSQHLKVGDVVEAMIINVDRKTRGINLSIKAKDNAEQHEAMQKLSAEATSAASGTTNLGALLKAKLNQQG